MKTLSTSQLISPFTIQIPHVGHMRPPTIERVFQLGVDGSNRNIHDFWLNILALDPESYCNAIQLQEFWEGLSTEQKCECCLYDFFICDSGTMDLIAEILNFYFIEQVTYSPEFELLSLTDEHGNSVGIIDRSNYADICSAILQLNFVAKAATVTGKPKNARAAEIMAKFNAANKEQQARQSNTDYTLSNVLSALSAFHNSYNYTNIWSLTIYQLYDAFYKQNLKTQFDITAMRWAQGMSSEPFCFDLWYKTKA